MKKFLRALGLLEEGLTVEDLERAIAALSHNQGTPNQVLMSESMYETLKNIAFSDDNLKP